MRKTLLILLLTLIIGVMPLQAQGGSPADVIAADSNLSVLLAAADAAGLVGALGGDVTVFAPTNGAFGTLLGELGVTQEQLLADTALLQTVLSYHVVRGTYTAGDVLDAGTVDLTTVGGGVIQATFQDNRVRLNNGRAVVISPNRFGGVGVVHVINNVLLPPGAATTTVETPAIAGNPPAAVVVPSDTIIGLAGRNPDLSLFVAAVEAAGLTETLTTGGPFTVFVPTNSAIQTFATDLSLTESGLLGDTALLRRVLTYHMSPEFWRSGELVTLATQSLGPVINGRRFPAAGGGSIQTIPTVNGTPLVVGISGNRVTLAGQASVIATDFSTGNGIIHLIDNVMVP